MNFNLYQVDPGDRTNEQAMRDIINDKIPAILVANITYTEYCFQEGDYFKTRKDAYRIIGHLALSDDPVHRLYAVKL